MYSGVELLFLLPLLPARENGYVAALSSSLYVTGTEVAREPEGLGRSAVAAPTRIPNAKNQAAFSRSFFQLPLAARLFISARCVNSRWPAATFSGLPFQAFSALSCRARP
ncbi:hypothetical protein GA0061105_10798 [Rhizobium aethiopicum]|uniref:Uncharacterized protein n=1 Tax=Rhizobium aethiopicum TaxID=1138170 RepID=A0A1C3Y4L6_9HYPH|nr:hypothetical protein GA0061105_10798 [Rhizobium aethiopicum]